jgi:glycosyltransferase involved in cell wall biosynthesis
MAGPTDVAILSQSPWLRGGFRSQAEAFWNGTLQLGREPHLFYIAGGRRSLSLVRRTASVTAAREEYAPLVGTAYPAFFPELDSINQLANARRLASPLRRSRSVWVVTTSAHYGLAATRCGRPYGLWVGTSWGAEAAARVRGLPPSRRVALRMNTPVFNRCERAVLLGAELVFATTPASRAAVVAASGLCRERVGLLPIPIDPVHFSPEPDDMWRDRLEEPVVVFVGRSSDPRKNIALLAEAFGAVQSRVSRARLRLVGRSPLPAVRERLPAGAEVCGVVDDVAPYVRNASLFVLPSLQEGFGVAVAEALACGVPAIVTPCGGPEHLIRASGGGVVLSSVNAEELAATAVSLLGDPDRLAEMRTRGRSYVLREHAPARFRERLRQAFHSLDRRC